MKPIISMGELITEAHNSRDHSSLLLVEYDMKKKPNKKSSLPKSKTRLN